jgi:hypothetical protein
MVQDLSNKVFPNIIVIRTAPSALQRIPVDTAFANCTGDICPESLYFTLK